MGLTLPVSDFVQVNVNAASAAVAAKSFNQGLIIGPSAVIPSTTTRLEQFASLAAVAQAGFTSNEPEYIAAELYFSANPLPPYVWIGRQDLTALQTLTIAAAGSGYVVGDVITVVQGGGSGGKATVATVNGSGGVTGIAVNIIGSQGTGYSVASSLATTGGTGTGLTVNITAIGETYAQALQACYLANQEWYFVMCCNATDSDDTALAALSSANWQNYLYLHTIADAAIPAGTAGNQALTQQGLKNRALLTYDTTQGGVYPNNAYAAAAVMGIACGYATGLGGSAFTLNLKSVTGVEPEFLTQTEWTNLQAANCNTVSDWGAYIGYFASGVLSSGEFLDQILFRAMLVNLIQTNEMNLLTSVPSVPQTDAGEHQLISQVEQACQTMQGVGYIASGAGVTWTEAPLVNPYNPSQVWVATGQALPNGFAVFAPSFQFQSTGDKSARKAMPIYVALIEAGAVHSVVIQVNTQL